MSNLAESSRKLYTGQRKSLAAWGMKIGSVQPGIMTEELWYGNLC